MHERGEMRVLQKARRAIYAVRTHGLRYACKAAVSKIVRRAGRPSMKGLTDVTQGEREAQRAAQFDRRPKISVLTPVFNTPERFLREMIESVIAQTYANWELCLCDAGSLAQTRQICEEYAKKDGRIVYRKLSENRGISENTNACIAIASGEYLALLDHDDVLHEFALYEVVSAINGEGADFIFTDEAKFTENTAEFFAPNFKPGFAKDELRAHNYICHLTVYARSLLDAVGGYRKECDGSQDHDMVLRLSERAKTIVHIPKILYFWRVHKGSVSSGVQAKAYAIDAALLAVQDQIDRVGEKGRVRCIPPYPSLYKVDYEIEGEPMISVVVYGDASEEDVMRCIRTIEEGRTYYPAELILAQGAQMSDEAFDKAMRRLPTVMPLASVRRGEMFGGKGGLNLAVERAKGEYVAFVHAQCEIKSDGWMEEMLAYAQRRDVGVVGARLYDGRMHVYSMGMAMTPERPVPVHHMFRGEPYGSQGYEAGVNHVRNVTAVDGACVMMRKSRLEQAGGIDEAQGAYAFVALCLKMRKMGLLNVVTPFCSAVYWGADPYMQGNAEACRAMMDDSDLYYNPNVARFGLF